MFKTIYWGSDQSTEAIFEPVTTMPSHDVVTACMVIALHGENNVVLSKPKRGWGILGGHRELYETPEECVRREAMEEAAVELGELQLVGRWAIKKRFESEENRHYPDTAHQLLYIANVVKTHDFTPQLEIEARAIVPIGEVAEMHHNFVDFKEVFEYALATDETSPRIARMH
jgi:8-oxo-dGTP diphosphatase